jgi:hypothetical protein
LRTEKRDQGLGIKTRAMKLEKFRQGRRKLYRYNDLLIKGVLRV